VRSAALSKPSITASARIRIIARRSYPRITVGSASAAPQALLGTLAIDGALDPLLRLVEAHVMAAGRLHADDTTVPVLSKGKTDAALNLKQRIDSMRHLNRYRRQRDFLFAGSLTPRGSAGHGSAP
jgi:hypothetical protein